MDEDIPFKIKILHENNQLPIVSVQIKYTYYNDIYAKHIITI